MYDIDSHNRPFWAENSGFMTGRDPLGVQNSSIKTYGRLLPGMTNLTLRLRYYGFYMWVLSQYELRIKRDDITIREHYNFIRRAELILAFVMNKLHPKEQSIIGSDFTSNKAAKIFSSGYYLIDQGADKLVDTDKGTVYWDYDSGALGQYYAGSLVALKLITIKGKYFEIEEYGNRLAKAYDDNINEAQKTKFLKAIESGKIDEETMSSLSDFAINNVKVNTDEWGFYCKMLLDIDGIDLFDNNEQNTSLRKETIKLYLDYLTKNDQPYHERSFIKWQYQLNQEDSKSDSSFGWYYYYINEAFHIALETIFWAMLVDLQSEGKPLEEFMSEMSALVLEGSRNTFLPNQSTAMAEVIASCKKYAIVSELENVENEIRSPVNNMTAIVLAYKLMLTIYAETFDSLAEIVAFEKKYKIDDQKGRISENLMVYIENAMMFNYEEFVRETIKKIINDHINTAYRKMGNGESNLLKFIIDDGVIYHIQTMHPRHTSPRLRALENFMTDLSLVDSYKQLTTEGTAFLKSIA